MSELFECLLSHIFYLGEHTAYKHLFSFAPTWTLSLRKALIKILRSCHIPPEGSQLYNMTVDHFAGPVRLSPKGEWSIDLLMTQQEPRDFSLLFYSDLKLIEPLINSNIISPLLIQIIRSAPCTNQTEISHEYTKAIESELHAHRFRVDRENYDFFGILLDPTLSISHAFPVDVTMQTLLKNRINEWLMWCARSNRTFFPKASGKTSSNNILDDTFFGHYARYETPLEMEMLSKANNRDFSFRTIERFRYRYEGSRPLQAREEMRRKWSFKDNKPRPYYAMGATSFIRTNLSRQIILNLCDRLPGTHRTNKLVVDDLILRPGDDLFLYDYTAFTSSFYVVQCFLRDLEQYVRDFINPETSEHIQLEVVQDGKVEVVAMHDLIHDLYLAHHNVYFTWKASPDLTINTIAHSSGLLGVFSNIVLSTFVHGIFLLLLTGGEYRNKCAGDDALTIGKTYQFPSWTDSLQTLASFELSKAFQSIKYTREREDGEDGELEEVYERMVYLKRPLLYDGVLIEKWELMPMYSFSDFYIPPQYTDKLSSPLDRMNSIMSGIRRLLLFLYNHIDVEDLTQLEIHFIQLILALPYDYGFPQRCHLPSISKRGQILPNGLWIFNIKPYANPENFKQNPYQLFLADRPMKLQLPVHRIQRLQSSQLLSIGQSFSCNITPALSYLSKIGVISKAKVKLEYISKGDALDTQYIMTNILGNKHELVYEFTVLEHINTDLEKLVRDQNEINIDLGPDTNVKFFNDEI